MNRELKDIMQLFSIVLFPFGIGAIFAPFVRMQFDLESSSSSLIDEVAMAWYLSSITFGLLAMIIVAIIGKLYERAGRKAWKEAMNDIAILDGHQPAGSFDSGFFYWAYQVNGRVPICTRFAPRETRNRSLVI